MGRRKKGSGQITYVDDPNRKAHWRATITDSRGKQKSKFFKTEKEAKAFLRDVNSDANKLKSLMENGVTFSAFAQVFLDEKKKANMKPSSYNTLVLNVERVCGLIGNVQLRQIDSDLVQQVIFDLAKQDYSESVMTKSKIAINSILKMAAAKHFLDAVPIIDITIPAAKKQDEDKDAKHNWLRKEELAAYETECKRTYVPQKYTKYAGQTLMVHVAGYKLLFLVHTGLRLGEGLALTWDDYDEYSKTILVDKNMVYVDGKKIIQHDPKTDAGDRIIVLNKKALEDIRMLRKQFDEQTAIIAQKKQEALREAELTHSGTELKQAKRRIQDQYAAIEREHKYICGASTFPFGSGVHSSTLQTHKKICKAIGLSHAVTVHGLRHTYVTHYYLHHKNDLDFDLATFSRSIGHSSIRTTMEIYAHLDMTENRYIQRSVDDLKDF